MRPNHCFRHSLFATLILGLMVAVSGCSGDNPSYAPDPRPGGEASPGEPLFASDKEALEAAADAYRAYYAVVDQIFSESGAEPERVLTVATEEILQDESTSYETFVSSELTGRGSTTLDSFVLQAYNPGAIAPDPTITVYACIDVTGVDVLDANGVSAVNQEGRARLPFEASFISDRQGGVDRLILSAKELWTGEDFCVI
jgi:hypothetical protein